MTASEHFIRNAAECEFMAKLARDTESKAVWIGLAKRWHRCAALADEQNAQQREHARQRKAAKMVSH